MFQFSNFQIFDFEKKLFSYCSIVPWTTPICLDTMLCLEYANECQQLSSSLCTVVVMSYGAKLLIVNLNISLYQPWKVHGLHEFIGRESSLRHYNFKSYTCREKIELSESVIRFQAQGVAFEIFKCQVNLFLSFLPIFQQFSV